MTVHVVIREDQNEHGFIDTSIVGLFRNRSEADAFLQSSAVKARTEGMRVCGDPSTLEPDWDVFWMIEEYSVV